MLHRQEINPTILSPNFIGSWMIEKSICDELVNYFEKNKNEHIQGITSGGVVNLKVKDRKDISVSPKDIKIPKNKVFAKYFEKLFECYKDYSLQWPVIKTIANSMEIGRFNLGRYIPGQHFQEIHTERTGLSTLHRLFAFMTYLNDVESGGSTYFKHYDLKIYPKKGLTILWPAEWTHAHKGNPIKVGEKYIITGWLDFPTEKSNKIS